MKISSMTTTLPLLLGIGLLALVPQTGDAYMVTFIFTLLIAYILGQSWDWVAGEMGYINLGHYLFYGIGAYGFSILLVANYPAAFAMMLAIGITVVIAAVISIPLFQLRGDYFAFATLALIPLAELLAFNLTGITGGGDGVILPVDNVEHLTYMLALGLCAAAFMVTILLNKTRFGYALKGIRNDEQAAEIVGIRIQGYKVRILVLSAAFASLAGSIHAWQMSYIDPTTVFGLNVALVPIAMVLFGGSGLRWGPVIGVLILGVLHRWLQVNVDAMHAVIYGIIILLIGRYMPGGMLRAKWVQRSRLLGWLGRGHHEYIDKGQESLSSDAGRRVDLPLEPLQLDSGKPLVSIQNVTMRFGGNVAVNDVNLEVRPGEILGLIGPNGSGKTTLFNCLSRVYVPTSGSIRFAGRELSSMRRDEIAMLGIGRTYQIPRPFSDLTVWENVAMPIMFHDKSLSLRQAFEQAEAFLAYGGLLDKRHERADALSIQQRKSLEFIRALASKPKLLLIDEVASGLTPAEIRQFVEQIRDVRDRFGITVIWVEHIFSALEQVVDRVIVLEQGSVIDNGALEQVLQNQRVLDTYFGTAAPELATC
ncbi:MAG: branched-chain amino acid ABC transporter ATP-binding protein/permease [Alcaligenaceae bacterium]|nr:branched-chain amino acid ABC transporter ATP-binding protein/permease [Alcaligenaceae bacterium]